MSVVVWVVLVALSVALSRQSLRSGTGKPVAIQKEGSAGRWWTQWEAQRLISSFDIPCRTVRWLIVFGSDVAMLVSRMLSRVRARASMQRLASACLASRLPCVFDDLLLLEVENSGTLLRHLLWKLVAWVKLLLLRKSSVISVGSVVVSRIWSSQSWMMASVGDVATRMPGLS